MNAPAAVTRLPALPEETDELENAKFNAGIAVDRFRDGSTEVLFSPGPLAAFAYLREHARAAYLGALHDLGSSRAADMVERELDRMKGADKPGGFRFITVGELLRAPRPTWRVLRVIPRRGLIVVWGAPGSGKTFAVLDMALAIARGLPWCGRRTKRGTVAYVAAEGTLRDRVDAYMEHHGIDESEIDGLRVLNSAVNLLEQETDVEPLLADLQRLASETGGVALVILDTLNRAMAGGDENSSQDMGAVIATAKRIEAALGCAVLFVHHSGKDESRGSRGHSSLLGATDAEISVKRADELRTVTAEKMRDAEDRQVLMTFRLQAVDLGPASDHDPDADPDERSMSLVVVPGDAESAPKPIAPGGGNQRVAWDRIGELLRAAGDVRPDGAPSELPPGRPAVTLEAAIEAVGVRLVCDPKRRRERATEAVRGLCARNLLHHMDGWIWCP